MKKLFTLSLALILAIVNIGTASAASIKGKKLSFSANWNASMAVPAKETRVYNCGSQWQGVVVKNNVDTEIYKKVTFDYESTAEWYNFNVTDDDGVHYGVGFGKGNGTLEVDLTTYKGLIKELFIQNTQPSDTYTTLKIFNAYFTKANGTQEEIQLGGLNWGNGGMTYENPITHAVANFLGQWGSLQLNGANNIECGVKLRLYTKQPIPYGSVQYCVKYAEDNSDGWPQLTKVTDTYAECVIDRPLSSLLLQWTSTATGSIDIEAITFERLDGQNAGGDEDMSKFDFHKLTDVKAVPGIQTFSTEVMGGANHSHLEAYQNILHAVNTVNFYVEEGEKAKESIKVSIKKFDGTKVSSADVKILDNMLVVASEKPLEEGDYKITFAPNTFVINEEICDEEMTCIVAAVDDNNESVQEAKVAGNNSIAEIEDYKESIIYGVNLYQYAPGTKEKITAIQEEAAHYIDLLAEEEHIYDVILNFRKEIKAIRPILPKTDKYYAIKHKPTGLYLNMSGDKVILSKEATPVQFHLVEASKGMYDRDYLEWEQIDYTYHYSYIYNTVEQKYLGYNVNSGKLVSTNKKNTVWWVEANAGNSNSWDIEIAYKYERKNDNLFAPNDAKEGFELAVDNAIAYADNNSSPCTNWFIEECDAPVIPEEEESIAPEGYIAITDEAALEGQTVIIMNAETQEIIYGKDAQNIAVADLETATATTNVVTAYKIEKADNGFLFRCVTPTGGDYGLWGANPCYFNSQPNVGGVTFNLGKDQDVANGSTWKLTYDEAAKAWVIQSVANEGYLAGSTISAELTAKWVICASTENNSSATPEATAIATVEAAANATEVYNAAGARVNGLQKGLNIVKLANGKVVKIMK